MERRPPRLLLRTRDALEVGKHLADALVEREDVKGLQAVRTAVSLGRAAGRAETMEVVVGDAFDPCDGGAHRGSADGVEVEDDAGVLLVGEVTARVDVLRELPSAASSSEWTAPTYSATPGCGCGSVTCWPSIVTRSTRTYVPRGPPASLRMTVTEDVRGSMLVALSVLPGYLEGAPLSQPLN